MKTKPYVNIAHYDDRGDPSPPNSYRPEIVIGNCTFVTRGSYNGCMPIKKAAKMAEQIAKKLNIPVRHSWSVDTRMDGDVEIYRIYKDGEQMGYTIQMKKSPHEWDLYIGEDKEHIVCESVSACFDELQLRDK